MPTNQGGIESPQTPAFYNMNGLAVDANGSPAHGAFESHGKIRDTTGVPAYTPKPQYTTQVSQDGQMEQVQMPGPSNTPTYAPPAAQSSTVTNDQPWSRTTTLNPADQANLDKQRGLTSQAYTTAGTALGNVDRTLSQPLDFSSLPQMSSLDYSSLGAVPTAPTIDANNPVVQALYAAQTSRLDPRFTNERNAVETRLANQGITAQTNPGAYARELETFNTGRNDAYQQAMASSLQAGVGAQNTQFQQQLASRQQAEAEINQRYQAGVTSRQQAEQELLTLRNQPTNEVAALLGTSPGVSTPTFSPIATSGVAPPDIAGLTMGAYNAQNTQYAAQLQQQNANTGAVAGLGGAALTAGLMPYALPAAGAAGMTTGFGRMFGGK